MPQRPLIGVVLDEDLEPDAQGAGFSRLPYYALRMAYFDAVAAAGGAPIAIPYRDDALCDYLRICDGWLLPGGDYRFEPAWYAAPPAAPIAASVRRGFEARLATLLLERDAPVLGICNGMQVLAGASGGKIAYRGHGPRQEGGPIHGDPARGHVLHDVRLSPESRLAALYGGVRLTVSSAHKEDVTQLGPDAEACAFAEDGVIEAAIWPARRFALGVQWHPELAPGDPLFAALIAAAR